ncbi:recombinase family protein [Streptomyces sp. NPDC101151]|uniref:recombinase family protein n=1 Tax=Streptomyces sp. NPDC101151 TaxID=3366115 RepID=UPI00380FFBF2
MSRSSHPQVRVGRPRQCPDEVLSEVVRLRADGARLADICDVMNAAGVPTPGGGLTWWPSHVHRLLRTRDGEELLARAHTEAAEG